MRHLERPNDFVGEYACGACHTLFGSLRDIIFGQISKCFGYPKLLERGADTLYCHSQYTLIKYSHSRPLCRPQAWQQIMLRRS
jgi:hypothetical protein